MSSSLARVLAAAAAAATMSATLLLTATAAQATSCATDPKATPQAIAAGTYRTFGGESFFDRFDVALVGTVTGKSVDPRTSRTTVTFHVSGLLGSAEAPAVIDVTIPDDGALNGYRFEVGRGYFVPLKDRTPDGLRNSSFLCDPITGVTDPDAQFQALARLAQDSGLSAAAPAGAATAPVLSETGISAGPRWTATGLLMAAGMTVLVRGSSRNAGRRPVA